MITRFYMMGQNGRCACWVDGLYPFEQDGRLTIKMAGDGAIVDRKVQMSWYTDHVEANNGLEFYRYPTGAMVRSITVRPEEPEYDDRF